VSEVQVVFWRDLPAQVKARQGRARGAAPLSPRFQEAIDAAAMRAGLTGTDEYLAEWRASEWEERDGSPQHAADRRAAEVEAEYPAERLRALIENGGRSS
jgi:hypothetical protein